MTKTGDTERRLIAIFAADVEGYSRLMGADEVAYWQSSAAPSMPFSVRSRRRRRFPKPMWACHLTVTSTSASASMSAMS